MLAALVAFSCTLPGAFSLPPLDRDESRFAQASLQMLESGDFVRIRFQDEPRNKKPVGIYWLQAASAATFSGVEARAIWAFRLPSMLAAALTAVFTFFAGARLFGREAAAIASLLLGASVLLSTEGMIAKTDAALSATVAAALWAVAALRTRQEGEAGRRSALAFWAAIAAGVLIKGPIAPMIAGLGVLALCLWERRWAWARPLLWPPALGLLLVMIAPWLIAIGLATEGRFFADALGGDLGGKLAKGAEGHGAPPGLHLLLLPLLSFPITLGLLPAAQNAWAMLRRPPASDSAQAGVRLLLAWIGPAWLIFELTPTKLVHYPLPLYSAVALLAGLGLSRAFRQAGGRWASLAVFGLMGLALAGVCAAASTQIHADGQSDLHQALQTGLALGAVVLLGAAAIARIRSPVWVAAIAASLSALLVFAARERIAPEARGIFMSAEASSALQTQGLHPRIQRLPQPLLSVGFSEPSLVFLTRTDTVLSAAPAAAARAEIGQAALVEARAAEMFAQKLASRGLVFEPNGPAVQGLNYSKGDEIRLQPGRIVAASAAPLATQPEPRE